MPRYDPPNEGYTQSIPTGTKAIREGVAAFFDITRHEVIRDLSRCQHQSSEHCVCRGVDWYTTDVAKGTKMRRFLIWAADKIGIQAAIFNNIVWGYGTWHERSPASSPHTDHVHGGVNRWGAANVTRVMVDTALAEWSGQEDEVPTQAEWDAFITTDTAWKMKVEKQIVEAYNNTRITDPKTGKVIGLDVFVRDRFKELGAPPA